MVGWVGWHYCAVGVVLFLVLFAACWCGFRVGSVALVGRWFALLGFVGWPEFWVCVFLSFVSAGVFVLLV